MDGNTIERRWRLTFSVTPAQSIAVMKLAHKAETSPSMVGQLAVALVLEQYRDATPLIPHAPDEPDKRSSRVTVSVTYDEYAAFMALALRARTSASALGQLAIGRLVDRFKASPVPILPAAYLPEGKPRLHQACSFPPDIMG